MLQIRPEQFKVFADHLREQFLLRMAHMLATDFPRFEQTPHDDRLDYAEAAMEHAETFGFKSSRDVHRFMEVCAALEIDVRADPVDWKSAAQPLYDKSLPDATRLRNAELIAEQALPL